MSKFGRRNSFFVVIDASGKEYSFVRGKNIRYAISESEAYKYMTDYFEPYFAQGSYDKATISLPIAVAIVLYKRFAVAVLPAKDCLS